MKNLLIKCDIDSFENEYNRIIDSLIEKNKGKVSFYIYDDSQTDSLILRKKKDVNMIINNIFDIKFIKYELEMRQKKAKENQLIIILCNKIKYDTEASFFLSNNEDKMNKNNMYYCIFDLHR